MEDYMPIKKPFKKNSFQKARVKANVERATKDTIYKDPKGKSRVIKENQMIPSDKLAYKIKSIKSAFNITNKSLTSEIRKVNKLIEELSKTKPNKKTSLKLLKLRKQRIDLNTELNRLKVGNKIEIMHLINSRAVNREFRQAEIMKYKLSKKLISASISNALFNIYIEKIFNVNSTSLLFSVREYIHKKNKKLNEIDHVDIMKILDVMDMNFL